MKELSRGVLRRSSIKRFLILWILLRETRGLTQITRRWCSLVRGWGCEARGQALTCSPCVFTVIGEPTPKLHTKIRSGKPLGHKRCNAGAKQGQVCN